MRAFYFREIIPWYYILCHQRFPIDTQSASLHYYFSGYSGWSFSCTSDIVRPIS